MADAPKATDAPAEPVEKPEAPEGFISLEDVAEKYLPKDYIKKELSRRTKGMVAPDTLLEDEDFKARAMEHWKVAPASEPAPTPDLASLREKIAKEIETKRVKPMEEEITKLRSREMQRRRDKLVSQIQSAAAKADIHAELHEEGDAGEPAPIVGMVESLYAYDEASDSWFRKDGDGFAASATGGYKSVAEGLADWIKAKGKPGWLVKDKRQQGAGLAAPGKGPGTGPIRYRSDLKTMADKVAFIGEHGQAAFEKLPAKPA